MDLEKVYFNGRKVVVKTTYNEDRYIIRIRVAWNRSWIINSRGN